jgi:hypothetical protein
MTESQKKISPVCFPKSWQLMMLPHIRLQNIVAGVDITTAAASDDVISGVESGGELVILELVVDAQLCLEGVGDEGPLLLELEVDQLVRASASRHFAAHLEGWGGPCVQQGLKQCSQSNKKNFSLCLHPICGQYFGCNIDCKWIRILIGD